MSKRRSRKSSSPNLPKATLERARAQAGLSPKDEEAAEAAEAAPAKPAPAKPAAEKPIAEKPAAEKPAPAKAAAEETASSAGTTSRRSRSSAGSAASSRARTKRVAAAQLERSKQRGELDMQTVEEALEHPTRFPSEDDLHRDYGYVLRDLRNMFILAGVLIVALILIATFL